MFGINKAFFWSLFAAGGTLTAFLFPVVALVLLIAAFGGTPDIMTFEQMEGMLSNWFMKLVMFGTIALALWHAGHRVRIALHELGVHADGTVAVIGYGVALVGTLLCLYFLLQI